VANKNDLLKQEIARAAAFDVFQHYRQSGATGSPATTIAGKKRLAGCAQCPACMKRMREYQRRKFGRKKRYTNSTSYRL